MNKLDVEYIEAITAGDQDRADEIASQIMNKYVECVSTVKVNDFEMLFFTAAIMLAAETMYNSMAKDSQRFCDILMGGTMSTMIAKPAKEEQNNE